MTLKSSYCPLSRITDISVKGCYQKHVPTTGSFTADDETITVSLC